VLERVCSACEAQESRTKVVRSAGKHSRLAVDGHSIANMLEIASNYGYRCYGRESAGEI
jgi:hypothetical protein